MSKTGKAFVLDFAQGDDAVLMAAVGGFCVMVRIISFRFPQEVFSVMQPAPSPTDHSSMSTNNIFETVVSGGYCIGCGACAVVSDHISMCFTSMGSFVPVLDHHPSLSPSGLAVANAVCPFSEVSESETSIAHRVFSGAVSSKSTTELSWSDEVGFYRDVYVGHVAEGEFRSNGSSGGMATWLLIELMARGEIDAVIHVRPSEHSNESDNLLFDMAISTTPEQVRSGSRSRYYPVTMAAVLESVKLTPDARYALVGVPCFIKAARLLAREDPLLAKAIRFHVGLVCGHFKTSTFADYLGWLGGVQPGDLQSVEFRRKIAGRPANQYLFAATSRRTGAESTVAATAVPAGDWGLGYFKYKACDFCDDVFAETADVVVGDAWLPKYVSDPRGTNVVVVRDATLGEFIKEAIASSRLALHHLSAAHVAESQRSGLRHRREGLACRLHDAQQRGEWVPPRRVSPATNERLLRRAAVYRLREQLSRESHVAFRRALECRDLSVFTEHMEPFVAAYRAQLQLPLFLRAMRWVWHRMIAIRRLSWRRH